MISFPFLPLIRVVGYCSALFPKWLIKLLCQGLGRCFFLFFRRRRRILLSNITHAFPEKTAKECKMMAQISCVRMIELGLLAIAVPYFSEKRIRKSFQLDSSIEAFFNDKAQNHGPRIVLLPHFSQMEAMTVMPLLNKAARKNEIGVIYRPFKNSILERWIRETREKFGLRLLARGDGFFEAKEILKRNGIVVILFDQNASEWGILETFLGRVAATTYLPDLLYKYFLCPVYMLMPQRLGVFQAKCFAEHLTLSPKQEDQSAADLGPRQNVDYAVARGMNIWLEEKLRSSEDICCDWLWVHNRWHVHRRKDHWLDLPHKRWAVDFKRLEKKIKIFIRMPNWLGDIIMALPFVKAVRQARPDTQLTLIVRQKFTQFLENLHISDCILPIGCRANGKTFYPLTYYRQLLEYRQLKPDFLIRIGNNSTTGDIETLLLNPQYCFTPYFLDKKKPYLSECIVMDRDGPKVHQTENLRYFLENMGCRGPWDLTPLESQIKPTNSIGLICGSENNPEKRWPNAHWVDLIAILLKRTDAHIVLFGTVDDHVITQKIKDQFKEESRVIDRAGQTSLVEFSNEIAHCRWVIGNDTGGVHLANFLKIPTVVLFGPSNPYKTRPIFDAPLWIIQSPDPKNFKTLTADFVAETLSHNNLLS